MNIAGAFCCAESDMSKCGNIEQLHDVELAQAVQKCLRMTPLILWGSGGTVPCKLPTMQKLAEKLTKSGVGKFTSNNFEQELGSERYARPDERRKIRRAIWDGVYEDDCVARKTLLEAPEVANSDIRNHCAAISRMLKTFRTAQPQRLDIVTTNYDRVLESVAAYYGIPFSDGTGLVDSSRFDVRKFGEKDILNVIKVHGSLLWRCDAHDVRVCHDQTCGLEPCIIIPGKNKYHDAFQYPYRELIQYSDSVIDQAKCVFAYGFGFHDEHITSKIKRRIYEDLPIVVVAKELSSACLEELKDARRAVFIAAKFEDGENRLPPSDGSRAYVRIRGMEEIADSDYFIEGPFWTLPKFMDLMNMGVRI